MIFLYHRIAEICFPWIMCQPTNANDPLWVVIWTMTGCLVELVVFTWIWGNHNPANIMNEWQVSKDLAWPARKEQLIIWMSNRACWIPNGVTLSIWTGTSRKLSKEPEAFLQFLNLVPSAPIRIIQSPVPSSLHHLSYVDLHLFLSVVSPRSRP